MRTWRLPLLVAIVIFGVSAASAAESQIERRAPTMSRRPLRHVPLLNRKIALPITPANDNAPMMASNTIRNEPEYFSVSSGNASAVASGTAAMAGGGAAVELDGAGAPALAVIGPGPADELTLDGSSQREATMESGAFASAVFADELFSVFGGCAGGSSAWASATERGIAVAVIGAIGVADGDAFGGAICETLSCSSLRYQQWRLEGCSMR